MTMARNASRSIVFRSTASPRFFSTTTVKANTVTKESESSLFRKLLAAGGSESSICDTLDEWAKDRKSVNRLDFIGHVTQLRKFKKYHKAIKLYEWMEKSKVKMNNADRAIRVDLLAKTTGVASAEKYFENLHESGKTKKTYGSLLNCYCKEKMLDKALELFEKMKGLDCTSTLNYNTMMTLYLSIGQPEKVFLLAEEMEAKNIAADLYTYNQLMNAHASLKDLDAVEGVLEKMEANKVKRDWFTYGNLATIYVNSGLVQKANSALAEMEKMENLRNREAFHTLITLYARTSNLSGVNRAWESVKSVVSKPSNVSYLIMLLSLSKLGDVDAVEKCFREWESKFSSYDVRVSNVILESYLKRDMIEEANSVYESIMKNRAEPNLKTLELFANYHIKKRDTDLALKYLEMGASKVTSEKHSWFPTDETVRMFLRYFEEENDVDKAEKFCESMKKIGRLDPTVYDSLLCTNIAAGKVEPQIFQGVKEEITPKTEELLDEK